MKKRAQQKKPDMYCIPLIIWIVVIPLIVKMKLLKNPLQDASWFDNRDALVDFFLYYKSVFIIATGVVMLLLLFWQISRMHTKDILWNPDTIIFIPLIGYLILACISSLFSDYRYFCVHGMPEQFESVWCLLAYVITVFYCYCLVVYYDCDAFLFETICVAVGLVGTICFLQYFKVDIYRLIYSGEQYSFTFEEGTVYGPFYNINYVGNYVLLFIPLFILFLIYYKSWKIKGISFVLTILLLVALFGAKSSTSVIALAGVFIFAILFLIVKNIKRKQVIGLFMGICLLCTIGICIAVAPLIVQYLEACDTEKTDLEHIYTLDDCVEFDYQGQKLFISMSANDNEFQFALKDQNQQILGSEAVYTDDGYLNYTVADERFSKFTLVPTLFSKEPEIVGFTVCLDEKNWSFTNQFEDDDTYYYLADTTKLTKLTGDMVSADFEPLVDKSSLASGRGYIWNKTIALLKNYLFLGSGADTFALVYPNDDFVDLYNNGYSNMYVTKPHNLYLQIAIQSGVLSLICFLVFYGWYFISSLRLYFRQKLDQPLAIAGFAIMLGTLGYMIAGLANDSTVTVAPLYWALLGMGIGINHKIRTKEK